MRTAIVAALAALGGAGLMYWKGQRDATALRTEIERLSRSPVPVAVAAPAVSPAPAAGPATQQTIVKTVTSGSDDPVTRAELLRLLDEKNGKLAANDASLRELRERAAELEAKLSAVTHDTGQLSSVQQDLKEQLATATRLAESLQQQMRGREERLAQVEVSNQDLRKRGDDASKRLTALSELSAQMDDVARRRESYLNNVLRRYREATELFRTLSLRLDNPRGDGAAAPASNDLARIQQAISAADEDLRQIYALNAQAAKIQKDLAAARRP